jgi:hypothetical protein
MKVYEIQILYMNVQNNFIFDTKLGKIQYISK